MDDQQFGTAIRTLRLRRRWRQEDLARAAHASRSVVSRIERGHVDGVGIERTRRIAAALEARVSVDLRWRGGEIARLLDQRHAAMQEGLAARLGRLVGWQFVAEASFSVYGERGSIDLLAWHAQRQALLVIELKSELPDLQDLLATLDRKRRLAPVIAGERGWRPRVVAAWVVLEESHGNRRRVATHEAVLRHSYPVGARQMSRWLVRPDSPVAALSFLTIARPGIGRRAMAPLRRAAPCGR
ncbi:MAG TPA: helix-turn-helix transcriptional regulator [Candidatus Acidoferrales bacterium]|nr:helix-turn-helix transcriptional regulator [Candidatus Acidoferrales bacterium]